MSTLKTLHPLALQLLMTEDLYTLGGEEATTAPTRPEPLSAHTEAEGVAAQENPAKAEPPFFEYLGENNKYILVLVHEPAHAILGPKELETLANILKGKKQEIKDVAVVNLNNYPSASFTALKSFFACNSIIIFGVNPAQVGIEGIQANQISSYQGTKILATYSIAEMLNSVDKKRTFWEEMKKL